MKQTLTIIMMLIASVAFGQKKLRVSPVTEDSISKKQTIGIARIMDYGSLFVYSMDGKDAALSLSSDTATLTISSDKIRFIKIGGEVYEIKRRTTLERFPKTGVSDTVYSGGLFRKEPSIIYYLNRERP